MRKNIKIFSIGGKCNNRRSLKSVINQIDLFCVIILVPYPHWFNCRISNKKRNFFLKNNNNKELTFSLNSNKLSLFSRTYIETKYNFTLLHHRYCETIMLRPQDTNFIYSNSHVIV